MNLARILSVIPAAQSGVLFTSVAWAVASRDIWNARRHIHEAVRFAMIIAVAALVILGLDGAEVLSVLFSRPYGEGYRFLPIQLAGLGLFALLDVFSHALMAAGRQSLAAAALVTTVPLACLGNYLLVPRFGALGAATAMLIGVAIGTGLTAVMVYRYFGGLVRYSTIIRVFVAAIVVASISLSLHVTGPLVVLKLIILGGVYLFVLYMLGEVSRKDFGLGMKGPELSSTS